MTGSAVNIKRPEILLQCEATSLLCSASRIVDRGNLLAEILNLKLCPAVVTAVYQILQRILPAAVRTDITPAYSPGLNDIIFSRQTASLIRPYAMISVIEDFPVTHSVTDPADKILSVMAIHPVGITLVFAPDIFCGLYVLIGCGQS